MILMVQEKPENIYDDEAFARLLEEKLGRDAAEYFRDALSDAGEMSKLECTGECDATYELQERYEDILRDVRDEVGAWPIRRLTKEELIERRDTLYEKIDRQL